MRFFARFLRACAAGASNPLFPAQKQPENGFLRLPAVFLAQF
jgi:hypothetical protein